VDTEVDVAVASLLKTLRKHDEPTYHHCLAVGMWAARISRAMGLPAVAVARTDQVGRLHDVGKCAVPVRVLNLPGALSPEDLLLVRKHVIAGERLVREAPPIAHLAPLVRAHHERFDGHGYPDGVRGRAIPLESRIVAVADTFDALTSGRSYRPGISIGDALTILTATRDRQWDADVVDAFIGLVLRDGAQPRRVAVPA
jgi:HD-GYP domain-containing protein (c-di-GMP phosphodiesterase class II)